VIIPGGYAPDLMRRHEATLTLVRDAFSQGKVVAAICHAGWVLASAGILKGRRVTAVSAIRDDLVNAGAAFEDAEVVVDGRLVTSRKPDDLPAFCREIIRASAGSRMLKLGVFFKIAAGAFGRWLARKVTDLLDLLGFFTDCLSAMIRYRHRGRWLTTRAILQQIYFTGVQSLELICSIALLVGGLVVIQGTAQLTRVGSREGLAVLLTAVIIREVGPLLTRSSWP